MAPVDAGWAARVMISTIYCILLDLTTNSLLTGWNYLNFWLNRPRKNIISWGSGFPIIFEGGAKIQWEQLMMLSGTG
ncbi:hypothetical protein PDE_01841 [Penicillium oxalicum 114-2]|uniref:Uncharacterized protein n=1 Tax=Penicillium oxalicum (strain 114-2 / CGMCC 5302) TaxID=933388 RepID=S7ZDZ6_PENO1|nr:hypothetical protein PDE_01841 [Penicillium oxalicum 114-2]